MFTVKTSKKNTIVIANDYIVGAGYKRILALAEERNAKVDIVKVDGKARIRITFSDTGHDVQATGTVAIFEREYAKAHKAYTKQTKSADNGKSKKTPSSSKKTNGKGKAQWQKELGKLAGKGTKANKEAAAILRAHGMQAQIGTEGWSHWESIR